MTPTEKTLALIGWLARHGGCIRIEKRGETSVRTIDLVTICVVRPVQGVCVAAAEIPRGGPVTAEALASIWDNVVRGEADRFTPGTDTTPIDPFRQVGPKPVPEAEVRLDEEQAASFRAGVMPPLRIVTEKKI